MSVNDVMYGVPGPANGLRQHRSLEYAWDGLDAHCLQQKYC